MNEQAVVTVLLAIASWAVSGTITYGFMKAKIGEFERRLQNVENDQRQLERDFINHQLKVARRGSE